MTPPSETSSDPMRPTLNTRKPINQLTADDPVVFPVWEFAIDEEDVEGRDETWVRPVDVGAIPKGMWSLSVAADFRTSAGMEIPGLVGVTTAGSDVAALRPYLVDVDQLEDDDAKAHDDAEFALADEWVFTDFWRRLGIAYPDQQSARVLVLRLSKSFDRKLPTA